ncbi:MAG: hypothetical protein IJY83_08685, partial [Oscillospiraceae bacterium]|nr:hypothetical protein [Oscillospiraceae bacterium]
MMTDSRNFVTSYTRPYYNGVIRKSNSKLILIGKARRLLIEEYRKNYLNSKAAFSVYCINNRWGYDKVWECPLDFATFEYDTYYAELFCKDNSATALIKSNNNTKFEFPVDELKDENQLKYDGIVMRNSVKYVITADNVDGEDYLVREFTSSGQYWYPPLFKTEENLPINDCITLHDQTEGFHTRDMREPDTTKYFLECKKDCTISIDLTKLIIRTETDTERFLPKSRYLFIIKADGTRKPANGGNRVSNFTNGNVALEVGDKMQLLIPIGFNYVNGVSQYHSKAYIYSNESFITWQGKIESVDVDCISLNTLLGKILSSISSNSVTLTGSICETINGVENERLKNTKIVAAESIRQMVGAKIYTSFKDFSAFMESVFGYVYEIIPVATEEYTEDSIVTFRHRSEVFA